MNSVFNSRTMIPFVSLPLNLKLRHTWDAYINITHKNSNSCFTWILLIIICMMVLILSRSNKHKICDIATASRDSSSLQITPLSSSQTFSSSSPIQLLHMKNNEILSTNELMFSSVLPLFKLESILDLGDNLCLWITINFNCKQQ